MGIGFPVLAVEIFDSDVFDRIGLEATCVDTDPFGIGARHIKGFDAAMPTKIMLRHTRIEGVRGQCILAFEQAKSIFGYNQV